LKVSQSNGAIFLLEKRSKTKNFPLYPEKIALVKVWMIRSISKIKAYSLSLGLVN